MEIRLLTDPIKDISNSLSKYIIAGTPRDEINRMLSQIISKYDNEFCIKSILLDYPDVLITCADDYDASVSRIVDAVWNVYANVLVIKAGCSRDVSCDLTIDVTGDLHKIIDDLASEYVEVYL